MQPVRPGARRRHRRRRGAGHRRRGPRRGRQGVLGQVGRALEVHRSRRLLPRLRWQRRGNGLLGHARQGVRSRQGRPVRGHQAQILSDTAPRRAGILGYRRAGERYRWRAPGRDAPADARPRRRPSGVRGTGRHLPDRVARPLLQDSRLCPRRRRCTAGSIAARLAGPTGIRGPELGALLALRDRDQRGAGCRQAAVTAGSAA